MDVCLLSTFRAQLSAPFLLTVSKESLSTAVTDKHDHLHVSHQNLRLTRGSGAVLLTRLDGAESESVEL